MSGPAKKSVQIRALMADGNPRTPEAVAAELGIDIYMVRRFLKEWSQPGDRQHFQSITQDGTSKAPQYVICKRIVFSRIRRGFDWPIADPLVIRSFDAMVRAGVSA